MLPGTSTQDTPEFDVFLGIRRRVGEWAYGRCCYGGLNFSKFDLLNNKRQ